MSTVAQPRPFRLTGWHVLGAFVAFFGLVIVADTLMVIDAYRSYPGEAAASPYADGLLFDDDLAQQARQAALGWRMTAGFADPSTIVVTATAADGRPLAGLKITGGLERPATVSGRRQLTFREVAPGAYQSPAPGLTPGAWDLSVSANDGHGHRFDADRRLVAP